MQARTVLVFCGLLCLAAAFRSNFYTLQSYDVQPFLASTIPLNEAFISGFYVAFLAVGDLGVGSYYPDNPSFNDLNSSPNEALYFRIYNDRGEFLEYKWLGGNSDRILTTINGKYCYNQCVSNNGFAQSYNGVGQSGALLYGYLYIPDSVAGPFLSGVNALYTLFGWGSGVDYLTQGSRSAVTDHIFFITFNPAVLVGDPHLQTDYGYQQSIQTFGATEEVYALYCDFEGNWINGVVHNTLAGAYILTELELDVAASGGGRYSISGYRDASGFPVLVLNGATSYYFETYNAVGLELYRSDLQMMTWVPSDDPEFDGSLSRYYRRLLHIFYVYNSGARDIGRITIRVGFHPQMKGFFDVLVSPVPEPLTKVETESKTFLHTRNTIIPVSYDRPGGLLYKDSGDSLLSYAISDVTSNVCVP